MNPQRDRHNPWNHLKGFALSLGVSLVFYAINLPSLHSGREHARFILLAFIHGSIIYLCIAVLFRLQRAILSRGKGNAPEDPLNMPLISHFVLAMSGCAMGLCLAGIISSWITGEPFTFSNFWESLVIGVFIALMFLFYYAFKNSSQENLKLKAAKAEAELHVLRNQMQPHFLFNSLNSLAALIDLKPGEAGDAAQKLADLYRLILDAAKSPLTPLERELRIAGLYLDIERIRFGHRLSYLLPTLSPRERDALVPSLAIQTLVENAVKHGISASMEGGFVHITIRQEQAGLLIEILNSGAPYSGRREEGTGLRNTEERLALAFGERSLFTLGKNAEGLTRAAFLIPGAP
jgi:LytS/YehU family sensor histidine kinase